jgi:predicted nucleic acid-binding protein
MTQGIADTSVFTAAAARRGLRSAALPDELAISVITVGELRGALLAVDDYRVQDRRLEIFLAASSMDAIPIDEAVAATWARLRAALHAAGRSLRINASWIAATAISAGVPIVAHGHEFDGVPDLEVIRV